MEIMKQKGYAVIDHDLIKNTRTDREKLKKAAKSILQFLISVEEHIKPGVSTEEIDRWVHEETVRHRGNPGTVKLRRISKERVYFCK